MDRVDYESKVIQDIVNLHKSDELNLHPWYQRRSVWTRPQQAYLINTLFEQKPVPAIYIRHSLDIERGKSIKEVVDGQQRLTAILKYVDNAFAARHPEHDRAIKFSKLTPKQQAKFLMTAVAVGYLIGADDIDVIEIFGRMNSVAKVLNAQEKRNAKLSGEFQQFAVKEGAKRVQFWRDYNIFTPNNIARMVEVQFVSELAMNFVDGLQDYSTARIDDFYKSRTDSFPEEKDVSRRLDSVFSTLVSLDHDAIRNTIFSRAPMLFTLIVVLDSLEKKPLKAKIEKAIYDIDARFNSDVPVADRSNVDAEFAVALSSNPHRIRSRKIRDKYVRNRLSK